MKKTIYITGLLILCLWMISNAIHDDSGNRKEAEIITKKSSFIAGSEIILSFKCPTNFTPILFVQNSYGSTLLRGIAKNYSHEFKLPEWFAKKSGLVNWSLLIDRQKNISGTFEIVPKEDVNSMLECYFGPRQILAGEKDYSMLVVVPTDQFDNPLPENTPIQVFQQYQGNIKLSEVFTSATIAWQNIYSPRSTGKVLVSAACKKSSTKELTTDIYPANSVDFKIFSKRNHSYADGNQQVEFITSIIKDAFGNIVSDGTLVEFSIINSKGLFLKTYGETIAGTAVAKMLHPEFPDEWTIKAFISGISESNKLNLEFTSITNDFPVFFKNNNRIIIVGPIQSFMNQIVSDGIKVSLTIFKEGAKTETMIEYTSQGAASFKLDPEFYNNGTYKVLIEALGLARKYEFLIPDEKTK